MLVQTSIYASKEVSKAAFNQEWKMKPCRGRQRKPRNKYIGEWLGLDQGDVLDDITKGQLAFMPVRKYPRQLLIKNGR